MSKYEIKNGKIYISKTNFRKVHKDYKNSTKGRERMMALDPKSGATTSYEVVFDVGDHRTTQGEDEPMKNSISVWQPARGDTARAARDEGAEEIKKLEKMLKDLEKRKKKTPGDGFAKIKIRELIADLKNKKEDVELDERNYFSIHNINSIG